MIKGMEKFMIFRNVETDLALFFKECMNPKLGRNPLSFQFDGCGVSS